MKTLFIGNTFHERTGSSRFFQDMLRDISTSVDTTNADNTGNPADNDPAFLQALMGGYDLVVCWQCEHFAERLLPFHRHIVLVPMWDAARFRSPDYWARFRTIPVVSFSRALHEMLLRKGCDSHYFQFFPEAPVDPVDPRNPEVWARGFFWERRPNEAWNAKAVAEIATRLGLQHLHIHRVPDYGDATEVTGFPGQLTSSTWFPSQRDYLELKAQFGVFFAPRDFEGIGHGFLEGLALGQMVVSPNHSTASDYIVSGVNGLLLDDRPSRGVDPSAYPRLGQAARTFMAEGRRMWTADVQRLKRLLSGARMRTRYREALDVSACRPVVRQNDVYRNVFADMFPDRDPASAAPPFLSVVTVIRNAAHDLYATLRSLNDQTFRDFEVVIGDSFSTDRPEAVFADFGRLKVRHIQIDDSGIYDGMNKTVGSARGEYVYFLNAGDLLYDAHVLQRLRDAVGERRPALCFGSHIYTDTSDKVVQLKKARDFRDTVEDLREGRIDATWFSGFPSHQATFTRRNLLATTPYDTRFRIASDHHFALKAALAGHEVQMLDFVVACYEGGGFSSQNSTLCSAEWHVIYHQFSARPDRIDDIFSAGSGARLGPCNSITGVPVAGLLGEEGPYAHVGLSERFRWVTGEGLSIIIPAPLNGSECEIVGYLGAKDQEFVVSYTANDKSETHRCRASGEKFAPFRLLVPVPAGNGPVRLLVESSVANADRSFIFRSHSLRLVGPGDGGVPRVRDNAVPLEAFARPGPGFILDRPEGLSPTGLRIPPHEIRLVCRVPRPDRDLGLQLASSNPCVVEVSLLGRIITSERFVGETVFFVPCNGDWPGEIVLSIRAREGMIFGLGDAELRGIGHFAASRRLAVGEAYPAHRGGALSTCLGAEWRATDFEHYILGESTGYLRFNLAPGPQSASLALLLHSRDESGAPASSEVVIHVDDREPVVSTVGGVADWVGVPDLASEGGDREIVVRVENRTKGRELLLFSAQLA